MIEIWNDTLYMARHQPPYLNTKAGWGYKGDTVFFFYGITPKGNVSHYWASFQTHSRFSREDKLKRLDKYIHEHRPKLRKGYTWSEPRLYAGEL